MRSTRTVFRPHQRRRSGTSANVAKFLPMRICVDAWDRPAVPTGMVARSMPLPSWSDRIRGLTSCLVGLPESLVPVLQSLPAEVRKQCVQLPLINSDHELSVLYSSLDCFLHAAASGESFGLVLTEAMLCGCPVVTVSRPYRATARWKWSGTSKAVSWPVH